MPRPRVLVVTDDAPTAERIRTILAEHYDVDTASRAAEAFDRFSRQHYDLMLTSIRLPDVDGPRLYWSLRERWPSGYPRVIFLVPASTPTPGDLTGSEVAVLPVPVAPDVLREMVRHALGVF
jgi:DNA-binding response OmpR family regulator